MSGCPNRRTGKRHRQNTDWQNSRIEGFAEQAPYVVGGPVTAYPRQHKVAPPPCPYSLEGNEGRLPEQAHGKAARTEHGSAELADRGLRRASPLRSGGSRDSLPTPTQGRAASLPLQPGGE